MVTTSLDKSVALWMSTVGWGLAKTPAQCPGCCTLPALPVAVQPDGVRASPPRLTHHFPLAPPQGDDLGSSGFVEQQRLTPPGGPVFSLALDDRGQDGQHASQVLLGNHAKQVLAWVPPAPCLEQGVVLDGHCGELCRASPAYQPALPPCMAWVQRGSGPGSRGLTSG